MVAGQRDGMNRDVLKPRLNGRPRKVIYGPEATFMGIYRLRRP